MATQRIILVAIVCFSIVGFTGQTRQGMPAIRPRWERGMTAEEHTREMERWRDQRKQQKRKMDREHIRLMWREAWKRELKVTEQQWKIIEPKYENMIVLFNKQYLGSRGSLGTLRKVERFHWKRPSRDGGPMSGKTPDQMPEVYRILEEIIDVLEDEDSKDEEIRQKRDALQQFREKARKELLKARRELAAVLTTPRQEAVFLIMGYID